MLIWHWNVVSCCLLIDMEPSEDTSLRSDEIKKRSHCSVYQIRSLPSPRCSADAELSNVNIAWCWTPATALPSLALLSQLLSMSTHLCTSTKGKPSGLCQRCHRGSFPAPEIGFGSRARLEDAHLRSPSWPELLAVSCWWLMNQLINLTGTQPTPKIPSFEPAFADQ